jgi:hypothetical protein
MLFIMVQFPIFSSSGIIKYGVKQSRGSVHGAHSERTVLGSSVPEYSCKQSPASSSSSLTAMILQAFVPASFSFAFTRSVASSAAF